MQNLVTRLGIIPSIILIAVAAIGVSLVVTIAMTGLWGNNMRTSDIASAVLVPLLLVFPLAYFTLPTLIQLEGTEETLNVLANTDPLTTAFNRKHFNELADSELASAQRYGDKFSILLFDIDNFRHINEAHGSTVGDYVLRTLSEICRSQIRRSDIFARLGNDEFACLLSHTLNDGAVEFAERLRNTISMTSVSVNVHQVKFTISVGVKTLGGENDMDAILHQAFQALRVAKNQGKNRTVSADSLDQQTTQS